MIASTLPLVLAVIGWMPCDDPPLDDLLQFPPAQTCRENWLFCRESVWRCKLLPHYTCNRELDIEEYRLTRVWVCACWDTVDYAWMYHESDPCLARRYLSDLRKLLGDEDYGKRELPLITLGFENLR